MIIFTIPCFVIAYLAVGLLLGMAEVVHAPRWNWRQICRSSPNLFVFLSMFFWPLFLFGSNKIGTKLIKSLTILFITAAANSYIFYFMEGMNEYFSWFVAYIVSIVVSQFTAGLFSIEKEFEFVRDESHVPEDLFDYGEEDDETKDKK